MGLLVREKKANWAMSTLGKLLPHFDGEEIWELLVEIGLDNCAAINEAGDGFDYDLTDLQAISFAAAVASVAEVRGYTG